MCDFVESHGHHSATGLNDLFAKHFPFRGQSPLLRQVQSVAGPFLCAYPLRRINETMVIARTYVEHLGKPTWIIRESIGVDS